MKKVVEHILTSFYLLFYFRSLVKIMTPMTLRRLTRMPRKRWMSWKSWWNRRLRHRRELFLLEPFPLSKAVGSLAMLPSFGFLNAANVHAVAGTNTAVTAWRRTSSSLVKPQLATSTPPTRTKSWLKTLCRNREVTITQDAAPRQTRLPICVVLSNRQVVADLAHLVDSVIWVVAEEVDMIIRDRMVANKVKEVLVILVTTISTETPTALTVTPIRPNMDIQLIRSTNTPIIKPTPLKPLTPARVYLQLIIKAVLHNLLAPQEEIKSASTFRTDRACTVQTVASSTFKWSPRWLRSARCYWCYSQCRFLSTTFLYLLHAHFPLLWSQHLKYSLHKACFSLIYTWRGLCTPIRTVTSLLQFRWMDNIYNVVTQI